MRDGIIIREITDQDHEWVRSLLREHWASEVIVTRGRVHHADLLPGFVALVEGEKVGLATYCLEHGSCELVSVNALRERQGIGAALVKAVRDAAMAADCNRVWLITTNDNTPAMRFYEGLGFRRVAVHANAIEESRRLKPEIPKIRYGGTPILGEIEYEITLGASRIP